MNRVRWKHGRLWGEAYCFAKLKQDEIVTEYGKKFGMPASPSDRGLFTAGAMKPSLAG